MSDFNIVVAHFGHHNRVVMTDTLYQYDYGQKLKVEGITALPQTFQAHFSNVQHGGVSITVTGINGMVDVPNSLLMTGKRIYCWIYVTETGSGETVYQILMPVQSRPMPEYYDVEDVSAFDSVVNQVAEYAATATTDATSATASATAAAGSETAAATSATNAANSAENAAASEANAEASASAAQASDASAATAATTATTKAAQAAQSATSAGSAADRAEAAQEAAEAAQEAAETAATSATADAATATAKATAAAASATTASTKATDATNAATTATAQAAAAEAAKTTAVEAKTAAQSAQSAAETAATTATAKATEAAASATAAAQAAASINTPDSALSDSSTNPVQNKVITAELTDVKSALSVKSRNLLPIQPEYGADTIIDLGADTTFPNGIGIGFDAIDLVTSAATAGFVDFQTEAGTRAAIITLNSFRNNETGIVFQSESSPHNGRYNNASAAAFRGSLTFRYIIIKYRTPLVSSGVAKNFSITDGFSPTPYIPHDTVKDYIIEQDANPFDLYAEVNKTSIMDVGYWDIKTDVYTNSFGAINPAAGAFTTRLFPAKAGDTLRYKFSSGNTLPMLLIYDRNMQVIPSETVLGTGGGSYISGEHTFTEGECFFRLNGVVGYISNYSLSYNDVPVIIKDYVKSYVDGYAVGLRTFPAYWDTAVGNAVTAIKNQLLAMETGDCFVFVTDQHWTSNAQHSSAIIDYISEKTGIYNVFIGGDVVNTKNATQVGAMTEMLDYLGSFNGKNVRLFSTLGNHDRNSVAQSDQTLWLSLAQQYNALIKPEEEWLDTDGTPLCNVYDNKSQKVRYIQFWYTADSGYNADVASALVSAMTSTPDDYTVILMSHAYWNGTDPAQGAVTFANLILDTMDTMTATVALWVCGHVHADKTVVLTSTGGKSLRIMSTTTDSVGQHPSSPSMTAGTTTEQAFDVYCIDTTAKTINAIRVGAGESRSFTY